MKSFKLFLILSILCGVVSAANLEYSYKVQSSSGKVVKSGNLFVECGKSDENGLFKIHTRFNKNLLIEIDGYQRTGLVLKADPIQYVTPIPMSGVKNSLSTPEVLKSQKYEYPLYVVNGVYVPSFRAHNYTEEMVSTVTETNKWNKVTKKIFQNTDIESVDVVKRGVVMISTKEEINFNTPKNSITYTVIVVDSEGKPIEGATIYIKKGSVDKSGYIEFNAQAGQRAVITSGKYENYCFTLSDQGGETLTLQEKAAVTKKPKSQIMPSFQGGGISNFRSWLLSYIYDDLIKCRQADGNTAVTAMFVVGKSGKVICVEIIKENNSRAAKIVKNAIYRSPKWKPGIQNGKPVSVKYTIPVHILSNYD